MKKFLLASSILLVVIFIFDIIHYELGIFIDFSPNKAATTFVKTSGKDILLDTGDGYKNFEIKGVDMGSGLPGKFATSYAIDKKTYLRWFRYIQEMGANTIRVYTMLNDDFYNAFYEYNKNNDHPLYLIQGLWVNDYTQYSRLDAYSKEFREKFLKDSKKVVDMIHGKSQISIGNDAGTGFYFKDISPWTLGYILGVEWEDVTVAYTNDMQKSHTSYQGKYMKTTKEASAFEVLLAEVGDKIIDYETTRYKNQRLVAFSNWPTTDPFDYNKETSEYFKKIAKVDVEHIKTTKKFMSGHFASYHIYPYYPDYLNYAEEYQDYKDENGVKNTYQAYLKKINEHHKIPVVISEFGVPSSRGMAQRDQNTGRNQGRLNEKEQGKAIVASYQDIRSAGIDHAIIFSWQDEWFKRTWNTMHATDLTKTPYWKDVQTNEQHFGLLTFDPGAKESVCYVDGNKEEWQKKEELSNQGGYKLSAKYDEAYLYLYVNKKDYQGEKLYIPIDTTPKSGSKKSSNHNVTFSRDSDFLIVIDGKEDSHIFVQERYNTLFTMFGYEINEVNSYIHPPKKNSSKFQYINLMLQTATPLLKHNKSEHAEIYETGKLRFGNANPTSASFDSLADYMIKDDVIEIRIPWGLLNFSDPSNMQIHDDYYKHYGVSNLKIDKMYLGVGDGSKKIVMQKMPLKGWKRNITYHERLKESYYMVQEIWKERQR